MRLREYIGAARGRRFRYGSHDCVTFAGRWAEATTGRDILPRYSSLREGLAILGDADIPGRLDAEFASVAPLMAMPGDLVLLPSDTDLPALGIVAAGGLVACFVGREIGFVPVTAALRAWRVA